MDYKNESDEILIRLIAQAQTGALSELYSRYGRLIFAVAFYIVDDRAIAEEVTLDVFTRVWQKAATYDADQAGARVWLTSITRHQAIDVLRKETTRRIRQNTNWEEIAAAAGHTTNNLPEDPEQIVAWATRCQEIQSAIAQLPTEQKQAILLAYFIGLFYWLILLAYFIGLF